MTQTIAQFFAGAPRSARLHAAVARAVDRAGGARQRVSTSQVAFVHRRAFAWTWMPRKYLGNRGAPLVLGTVALRRRDRIASVLKQGGRSRRQGSFTHHLELRLVRDVDAQVVGWLAEARRDAGPA